MSESAAQSPSAADPESAFADVIAEITDRLQAGEAVDLGPYLARHPEWDDRLPGLLPALEVMAQMGSAVSGSAASERAGADPLPATLGDFRIVREVGRGGMGVVYEAEQISLGRRVALKVLPFAAMLDPRHLQRFHNEARAAAGLHHTNIVPVYGVGCERGIPYYAMQFIEGCTLADFIAGQRGAAPSVPTVPQVAQMTSATPRDKAYFRRVAEWGIQAAEALDCAHSLGVVHRDVKPANLLVDGTGRLWVTDFGLAQVHSDARLTMTGDLVGTLRYMSPEQALAKRVVIDHRTDVYSLGATLYELVALRPVFDGTDRHQLLRQIAFDEPRPPRRVDSAVPVELETIVLKAMGKDPDERYATAKDLADDLRRFLDDKTIHARKPTRRQRIVKWARRHQSLLKSLIAVLLLAVAGLVLTVFLIWREKEQTREALAKAEANYTRAEAARQRAEANARALNWALEDILCAFDPQRTLQPLTVAELKQWQTEQALMYLTPFYTDQGDDPSIRFQKACAGMHIGKVFQVRGEREKGKKAFEQAITVYLELVQAFPSFANYDRELATALRILAEDRYEVGRLPDANLYYKQAVDAWRTAVQKDPTETGGLLALSCLYCNWFDPLLRDPAAGLELARKAAALSPNDPNTLLALGAAHYRNGQWNAAHEALSRSMQWPAIPRKWDWMYPLFFQAMTHWRCGNADAALQAFKQADLRMANSFRRRDVYDRAIRAEVTALLGINERPTSDIKRSAPRTE